MFVRAIDRHIVPGLLVVALVGVFVFAGVRLVRGDGTSGSPTTAEGNSGASVPVTADSAVDRSGETDERNVSGIGPIDARHSDLEDAENAALDIVRSLGEVAQAGFISRRELVESFTTDAFGPDFASETGQQIDTLLMELGARGVDHAGLVIHEQPITTTSTVTPGGVRVRTWSVMILAIPDLGPGRQIWRTISLDMVAVDGAWLLAGWESETGPTPAPPAEGLVDIADSVVEVLSWRRVGDGEG
jgi:hypothetical protein